MRRSLLRVNATVLIAILLAAALIAGHAQAEAADADQPGVLAAPNGVRPTGASTARPLAERFSDVVNVRDYGARCDGATDDAAAFLRAARAATSTARNAGAQIYIPSGTCHLGSSLALAVAAGKSVAVAGDGAGLTTLSFAPGIDGVAVALGMASGASVTGLTIDRTGSNAAANTALAITEVGAVSGAVVVRDVDTTSDSYPGSWANGIVLTSTDNAVIDHVHTIAGFPPENSNGLVIRGAGVRYAVDTTISNSKFQGGNVGILVSGYVQGVLATNIFAIAGNYGVSWTDGLANPRYVPELLEITNSHVNAIREDVQAAGVGVSVSDSLLWRWPDGRHDSTPWTCIDLNRAGTSLVHHDNVNGGNGGTFDGREQFVHLTNSSAVKIDDNTVVTINGPYVLLDGAGSVYNGITGNMVNGAGDILDRSGGYNLVAANSVNGVAELNSVSGNLLLRAPSDSSIGTTDAAAGGGSAAAPARSNGTILHCVGVLASFDWNLPADPFQGQVSHISSECSIASLTVTPHPSHAGIRVIGAPPGMSPSTPLTFIYDRTNRVWARW